MLISDIKTEILTAVEAACQNRFGQKPEALKLGYPPQVELVTLRWNASRWQNSFGKTQSRLPKQSQPKLSRADQSNQWGRLVPI